VSGTTYWDYQLVSFGREEGCLCMVTMSTGPFPTEWIKCVG